MGETFHKKIILLLVVALIIVSSAGEVLAKKKKEPEKPSMPPYRTSGPIPGTSLSYEKLLIDNSGRTTLGVLNPEQSGVRFRATFSFYTAKNEFIAAFRLDGFAAASASTIYSLVIPEHKKIKNLTAYMTVLGRAGRLAGDEWE
ncbi:MAG: hypothetical protein LBS93_00480 [Synergistaceae bacterium]|jgi:hypothetical protein|nr:hypothetical protein [Synergistaceae bacterium]